MSGDREDAASRTSRAPPNVVPLALAAIAVLALLAAVAVVSRSCGGDAGRIAGGIPTDYADDRYEWLETWAGPLPRLRDGAQIVEWTAQVEGDRKPERYTLRVDGRDLAPADVSEVVPLTRPVTTGEEAVAQADLFRALRLAPGFGWAAQTGGAPGLHPVRFDAWARERDLSAEAIVDAASEGGWRIARPVVEFTDRGARIIVIRERVYADGSYEASNAGVLADEETVREHGLVVSDL